MNILNSNNGICPLCNNKLNVYLHFHDLALFKAKEVNNDFIFTINDFVKYPFDSEDKIIISKDFKIDLLIKNAINLNSEFNIFYICNESCIENKYGMITTYTDNVCYLAITSNYKIYHKNDNYSIHYFYDDMNLPISSEIFSIENNKNNSNKKYILELNYTSNQTIIWYYVGSYSMTNNVFTKTFSLLPKRPDFTNKEKLLSRLDSWILMS